MANERLNKDEAMQKASRFLSAEFPIPYEVEILKEKALRIKNGWVFFYESAEYLQTKQKRDQMVGNSPIFIDEFTGELSIYGSFLSFENMQIQFQKERPYWGIVVTSFNSKGLKILRRLFPKISLNEIRTYNDCIPNLLLVGNEETVNKTKYWFEKEGAEFEIIFTPKHNLEQYRRVII